MWTRTSASLASIGSASLGRRAERVGDVAPGLDGGLLVGLVEGPPDRGGDDGVLALGYMGERVSDPVNQGAFEKQPKS
jgi:hypothetical protein